MYFSAEEDTVKFQAFGVSTSLRLFVYRSAADLDLAVWLSLYTF